MVTKPTFAEKKYIKHILEHNTFDTKNIVEYYQGKSKLSPHGIDNKSWQEVSKKYKPILHKNEFGSDWWTFEKKSSKIKNKKYWK